MSPKFHLVQAVAGSAVLAPFAGLEAAVLFGLACFFIDLDHLVPYVRDNGRFRLKEFFRYYEVIDDTPDFFTYSALHTVEVFAGFALLALAWPAAWWLVAGGVFHMLADTYDLYRRGRMAVRPLWLVNYALARDARPRHIRFGETTDVF